MTGYFELETRELLIHRLLSTIQEPQSEDPPVAERLKFLAQRTKQSVQESGGLHTELPLMAKRHL